MLKTVRQKEQKVTGFFGLDWVLGFFVCFLCIVPVSFLPHYRLSVTNGIAAVRGSIGQ